MDGHLAEFSHPAWRTLAGTLLGYALALGLITLVLFGLPFVLWP